MHVSFLDLKAQHADLREELLEAIERVVDSGIYIGGNEVHRFEEKFGDWVAPGSLAVGCANGSDAIFLAAKVLRLSPGSEAIVPAMTYVATVSALMHAGLRVRLVDVTPGTWLMDPKLTAAAVSTRTRLLVPVHLYGQMAPMDAFRKIADEKDVKVLEDASQAHGATWKNRAVGDFGDLATYSFYPGKNLGALGDAGAILTRNPMLANQCAHLRNHGGLQKYQHEIPGFNSRLDPLQAAVLTVKLRHLTEWNDRRRNTADKYFEALGGIPSLELPVVAPDAKHVYHLFVVLTDDRDKLAAHLKDRGIETGVHYPKAIHQQPAFSTEEFATERFPHAERVAAHGLSLPMDPNLTDEKIAYVTKTIRDYFGRNANA